MRRNNMRRIIEVEEIVRHRHQICVEYESEGQLDKAIEYADGADTFDVYALDLDKYVEVVYINEDYSYDSDGVEYFDDYEEDEDE